MGVVVALFSGCSGSTEQPSADAATGGVDATGGDGGATDVPADAGDLGGDGGSAGDLGGDEGGGGSTCGDGVMDPDEACDGDRLGAVTCADFGFSSGAVTCTSACARDLTGCSGAPGPLCGDGALEGDEECDGAALGGATCLSLGGVGGLATCSDSCNLSSELCRMSAQCGDGFLDGDEECDDGDLEPGDGCAGDCSIEDCAGGALLEWFHDGDGDGAGAGEVTRACGPPSATSVNGGGDCDDDDPRRFPGAAELCDGVDNDCDDELDDDTERTGEVCATGLPGACGAGTLACVDAALQCAADRVREPEVCDGIDNDCDGERDEDAAGAPLALPCYDGPEDTEGVGPCHAGVRSCSEGVWSGCVGAVVPEPEVCDGADNDCDGARDDGTPERGWVLDDDGDGYGVEADDPVVSCAAPGPGFVALTGDCDDTDPTRSPAEVESVNGRDDDCDGLLDDGTTAFDDDLDGLCELAPCVGGLPDGDCNDARANVYPGAPELIDGLDNDCDGTSDNRTAAMDDDGDGYCEVAPCISGILGGGDCDDGDRARYPGAPELDNGVDDNCNGVPDDRKTWVGGAASSPNSWAVAENWSPIGVPTSADDVYIPERPELPSLVAAATVDSLWIEDGAALDLSSHDLTVRTDVRAGTRMTGAGTIVATGAAALLSGTIANLRVTGVAALSGDAHVLGDTVVASTGGLFIRGATLEIDGDLSVALRTGPGLRMLEPDDDVVVGGAATFHLESSTSAVAAGALAGGQLTLRGDLVQTDAGTPTTASAFAATGTRVLMDGAGPQVVSFETPGATLNRLGELVVTGDVTCATPVVLATLALAEGATVSASDLHFTGALPELGPGYLVDVTHVAGALSLGDTAAAYAPGQLYVDAAASLTASAPAEVAADVTVAGTLDAAGHGFAITGDLAIVAGGAVATGGSVLAVDGTVTMTGGTLATDDGAVSTTGALSVAAGATASADGGILSIAGDVTIGGAGAFVDVGTGAVDIGGALTIRWSGAADQGLRMLDSAGRVTIAGPWIVREENFATGSGAASLAAGHIHLRGDLTHTRGTGAAGAACASSGTVLHLDGDGAQLVQLAVSNATASRLADVVVSSPAATFGSNVWITGLLTVDAGATVAGDEVTVTSRLPAIDGTFGISRLNVSAPRFVADRAALRVPRLVVPEGTELSLAADFAVTGDVEVSGTTRLDGHRLDVSGALDIASGVLDVEGGALQVGGRTWISGAPAGLVVSGGVVTLASYLADMQSTNALGLVMTGSSDSVTVAGSFTVDEVNFYAATTANALTGGTLHLHGDFTHLGGTGVDGLGFVPTGTLVRFDGTATQRVSFATASSTQSRLHDVVFDNPAGVNLASNVWIDGTATVAAGTTLSGSAATVTTHLPRVAGTWAVSALHLNAPAFVPDLADFTGGVVMVDGGATVTLASDLTLTGTLDVRGLFDTGGGDLDVSGDLLVTTGTFDAGGRQVRVGNDLTIGGDGATVAVNGGTLEIGRDYYAYLNAGTAGLVMSDPGDSVTVGRDFAVRIANISNVTTDGRFTAGTLRVSRDISAFDGISNTGRTLVFEGTHVIMDGTGVIDFGASGPTTSRFQTLEVAPAAAVTIGSSLVHVSGAIDIAGTLSLPRNRTLSSAGTITVRAGGVFTNDGTVEAPACVVDGVLTGGGTGCPAP